MNNTYCENWPRVRERFSAWWKREPIGYPLLRIAAAGKPARDKPHFAGAPGGGAVDFGASGEVIAGDRAFGDGAVDFGASGEVTAGDRASGEAAVSVEGTYTNAAWIVNRYRRYYETHWLLEDSYPTADLNLGPGSMALYLGSEPIFTKETLWYKECVGDWDSFGKIEYDPDNKWWRLHLAMLRTAKALANDDFLITIPDIVENMDIVSALRGPQNLCYDLMDYPDKVLRAVTEVDDLYFTYYDAMYDVVKEADGSSAYTAFAIWGRGRTAKIQCDFCAMISPDQFREYAQPGLRRQCQRLDNSIYHLDGPDAIKHVPALMEIEELDGLQWTCGDGQPDGGNERWYPIYDQVRAAGKSLWIHLSDGGEKDWVESAERLIKRYGPNCLYLIFPDFSDKKSAEEAAHAIRTASRK